MKEIAAFGGNRATAMPLRIALFSNNSELFDRIRTIFEASHPKKYVLSTMPNGCRTPDSHVWNIPNKIKELVATAPIILLDIGQVDSCWIVTLGKLRDAAPDIPIVVIIDGTDVDQAASAIKLGATDYLYQERLDAESLDRTLRHALERKKSANRLRRTEARLIRIIENNADAVMVVRTDGRICFVNPAACRLFGKSAKEILDSDFGSPISGESGSVEIEILRKDYSLAYGELRASPITWDGHPAVIASIRDNTDKKKLEDELKLKNTFESIAVLSSGIAHDYNNLIAGVMGFVELAQLGVAPETAAHTNLGKAIDGLNRVKELTMRFLALSKGAVPVLKEQSISSPIRTLLKKTDHYPGIRTLCNISMNLWSARFDLLQIRQVFDIILENAVEAMDGTGTITVSAENEIVHNAPEATHYRMESGRYVKITISDHGRGIPKSILSRVFDPYFTTKKLDNRKGKGMGLAICYAIIQKHNGHITIDSTPENGTTVTLRLHAPNASVEESTLVQVPLAKPAADFKKPDTGRRPLPIIRVVKSRLAMHSPLMATS